MLPAVRLWKHIDKPAEGITEVRTGAELQAFRDISNGQIGSRKQNLGTFHSGLADVASDADIHFLLEL